MHKKDLLALRKRIIGYSSLVLASTLPLSGCSSDATANETVDKASSEISDSNGYYVNSPAYYVIKVQNIDGSTNKYLVRLGSMESIKYFDNELYRVYQGFDHYATLYIDVLTDEVVAIKYDTDYATTEEIYGYAIHDVLEETPAINYTSEYYGIKEVYTFEELSKMMEDINRKEYVKEK